MTAQGIADASLIDLAKPPQEVLDALTAGVVRVRRRVEIYESDATTPFDIPNWDSRLVDGNVTVDRTRDERRMCDFTLENEDGALVNDPYNGFWYDKILKAYWGIRYFDTFGVEKYWETQVGEFMIDRIDEDYFPHSVKVTGRDYTKKCLTSKLQYSLEFPVNTPVEDIIRALAANCGVKKFLLPYTGQMYTRVATFERGIERWKVMQQIADTIGMEVWFTPDGYLVMLPYPDPTYDPIKWTFEPGSDDPDTLVGETQGTLAKYHRSSTDASVFNHIIVIGATTTVNNPDGVGLDGAGVSTTIYSETMNIDPASPTRIAKIGDRVKIIQSDYITSQDQADSLAAQQLSINALEEYSVDFDSVMLPFLNAGDIVQILDNSPSVFTPKRFLLSSLNIPMKLGPMTGTAKRVTIVGARQFTEVS